MCVCVIDYVCHRGEAVLTEEDLVDQSVVDYEAGSYSPRLIALSNLEPDALVYDPADDMLRLEFARKSVLRTGQAQVCDTLDEKGGT